MQRQIGADTQKGGRRYGEWEIGLEDERGYRRGAGRLWTYKYLLKSNLIFIDI
jgi:hypothetical protein